MRERRHSARRRAVLRSCLFGVIGVCALLSVAILIAPASLQRRLRTRAGCLFECGPKLVRIVTGGPNGNYARIGALLEAALEKPGEIEVEVTSSHGSLDNLARLRAGQADFALAQAGLPVDLAPLVSLAVIAPQYVHLTVPQSSSIREARDLGGARVGVTFPDSGSAALAGQILGFYRFVPRAELVFLGDASQAQALRSGKVDATLNVISLYTPRLEELLGTGEMRLVPIAEAEALEHFIPGTTAASIPHSAYGPARGMPSPDGGSMPTLAVGTLLLTRATTDGALVREVLETMYSASFKKTARFVDLTEELGQRVIDAPLHPAAAAFYQRNDPVTADRFEIAAFFLSAIVVIASALHFLIGQRDRALLHARRRRIVPYFEEMLALGARVSCSHDVEPLTDTLHEMMDTQRRAESEWLAGRLDTEHMENLYAIYNVRSRNAFNKIFRIQLAEIRESQLERRP